MSKPLVGISSCLLGNAVRYDGEHTLNQTLVESLGQVLALQAFCPEVNSGMSIPRPPIQLRQTERGIRCVRVDDHNIDVTNTLNGSFVPQLPWLQTLHGFILKASSPSCGMEQVKVFEGDEYQRIGTGLFAQFLERHVPHLPIAEEDELDKLKEREQFILRVNEYRINRPRRLSS